MVNINLLPEKVRAAEVLKIVVILGVLSLTLPVLFWAYRYAGAKAELAAVEKQIDDVNVQLNSPHLKQVVAEVEQFGKDRADLTSKRSVVDLLRQQQVTLVRFLDILPDLVPKRAWLTSVVVTPDAKGDTKKVVVMGSAMSAEVVADFYSNLQAQAAVHSPQMDTPPAVALYKGMSIVTFTLSFSIGDEL